MPLTCQKKTSSKATKLKELELVHLPIHSVNSRDMLGEIVYVGKAVMKAMYLDDA